MRATRTRLKSAAVTAAVVVAVVGVGAAATPAQAATPNSSKCEQKDTWETNGHYLNVNGGDQGAGTAVITWYSAPSAANEYWCMEPASQGGWYLHPSYNTSLCLDVPYSTYKAGEPMWIWSCDGTEAQRFSVPGDGVRIEAEATLGWSSPLGLVDNGPGNSVTLGTSGSTWY